jgi:uncharacterized RDD family membrane protein YckC
VRPFYPGQPGSEYSFAGTAPYPPVQSQYYPAYYRSQTTSLFWPRVGAYIIDSIITGLIVIALVLVPLVIWGANFVSRHYTELEANCADSRIESIQCENTIERLLVDSGEIWGLVSVVGGFGLLAVVLVLSYYVFLTARGATIGKRVFGLRVIKRDGSAPGFGTALLRQTLGYWVSGAVFYLGYFWVAFDPQQQGWHDKIANTYVVKA